MRFRRKNKVDIFGSVDFFFGKVGKKIRTSRSKQILLADRMEALSASVNHSKAYHIVSGILPPLKRCSTIWFYSKKVQVLRFSKFYDSQNECWICSTIHGFLRFSKLSNWKVLRCQNGRLKVLQFSKCSCKFQKILACGAPKSVQIPCVGGLRCQNFLACGARKSM